MKTGLLFREDSGSQIDWFVRLRWFAIFGTTAAVSISQHVLFLFPREVTPFLWAGVGLLFLSNLFFIRFKGAWKDSNHNILFQIISDLAILTYLLHFSGDLENPFFILYIFHCILACLILPRGLAIVASMIIAGFFLNLSWIGGNFTRFDHYPLTFGGQFLLNDEREFFHVSHELPYIAGISMAFMTLLAGTTYFVIALVERVRAGQENFIQREKLGALGQLVAYIAHEVNNPIGIISTRTKLVRSGSPEYASPEFVRETLEIIDRQADRVGKIVRNLLGFLKYDSEPKSTVELNSLLDEALSIAEGRISKSGIIVEKIFPSGSSPMKAVPNHLVHAFLNLINNAIDAMQAKGVLRLETKSDHGWVEVLISDTGTGISQDNLKKIFEPLYTTKHNGTGLGLSLCNSLIHAAGGSIVAESEPGKGSVFTVRLPVGEK